MEVQAVSQHDAGADAALLGFSLAVCEGKVKATAQEVRAGRAFCSGICMQGFACTTLECLAIGSH